MSAKLQILFSILIAFTFSCRHANPTNLQSVPISHGQWDHLLKQNVDGNGGVDYSGFKKNETALNDYLQLISENAPNNRHWTKDEQLAYWINAYNAYTVKLILDHLPISSIKDIGPAIQVPFVNTPWQIKFIEIGGVLYNLDNIEHGIIRKGFEEPRIHFALVCAAKSCPKLRNEAYVSERLNQQLADQTRFFLSNTQKNNIQPTAVTISKIFKWYRGDFTDNGSLIDFLNQYSPTKIDKKPFIEYMPYDWKLNSRDGNQ